MENSIIFLRAEKPFFFVKIFKFFNAHPGSRIWDGKIQIRDQGSRMKNVLIQAPGNGMEKNRIRDPGSGINIPD
jgi:hypothetical protein